MQPVPLVRRANGYQRRLNSMQVRGMCRRSARRSSARPDLVRRIPTFRSQAAHSRGSGEGRSPRRSGGAIKYVGPLCIIACVFEIRVLWCHGGICRCGTRCPCASVAHKAVPGTESPRPLGGGSSARQNAWCWWCDPLVLVRPAACPKLIFRLHPLSQGGYDPGCVMVAGHRAPT